MGERKRRSQVATWETVHKEELDEIVERRRAAGLELEGDAKEQRDKVSKDLVGLAFSGGGIRSASFNLGLLQALHKRGVLRHVDFLSTVSGGGYIGSHLASLVLQPDVRLDRKHFPLQPKQDGQQPERVIEFIRGGKYLVTQPLQFVLRYITGLLLNSLVVVSGLIAACALLALAWRSLDMPWADHVIKPLTGGLSADWNRPFMPAALLFVAWIIVWAYSFWQSHGEGEGRAARIVFLSALAAILVGAAVLLGNREVSGLAWVASDAKHVWGPLAAVIAICLVPILRPWRLLKSGTRPASKLEPIVFRIASVALLAGIPLALVGYLARENISGYGTSRTELLPDDVLDSKKEFVTQLRNDFPNLEIQAKSATGPDMTKEDVTQLMFKDAIQMFKKADSRRGRFTTRAVSNAVAPGFWKSVESKEERVYADAKRKAYQKRVFPQVPAEYAGLQHLMDVRKAELARLATRIHSAKPDEAIPEKILEKFNRLYLEAAYPEHILNRAVISRSIVIMPDQWFRLYLFLGAFGLFVVAALLLDPNLTSIHGYYRQQLANAYIEPVDGLGRRIPLCRLETSVKGAPYLLINATLNLFGKRGPKVTDPTHVFVFSKKFCGSFPINGCPTSEYLSGNFDLASAMAISGAAITPVQVNNPLIAAVMLVLNLRLGQWLPNPNAGRCFWRPTVFRLLLDSMKNAEERRFCMLTDGGHHDNLGLYSLLKRECRLIVLSDAGQDGDYVFADFIKVYRRLRTRLGVDFFDLYNGTPMQLKALIPCGETRRCRRHHVAVGIRYSNGTVGALIYVKPSFTGDEEIDLERYRAINPEFPHQPTSDQVFNEDQFESYRQLGFHIGEDLCVPGSDELWEQGSEGRLEALVLGLTGRNWSDIEKIAPRSRPQQPPGAPEEEGRTAHAAPQDVQTLLKLAKGRNKEFRTYAVKELQWLPADTEKVAQELVVLLDDKDKDFRALVARTLGTFGAAARSAARSLTAALQDDDLEVRAEAAWALGEIGDEAAIAELEKALHDAEEEFRTQAHEALKKLGSG
jgi:hypothetical protein